MARGNEYFTDSRRPPAARSTSASAGVLAAVVTLVDEQEAPWVERADDAAGVPRGRKSKRARASRCAEGVRALSKCSPGAATSSPRASHCRERPSASAAAGGSRPGASPGVAARVVRQEIKNLSGSMLPSVCRCTKFRHVRETSAATTEHAAAKQHEHQHCPDCSRRGRICCHELPRQADSR